MSLELCRRRAGTRHPWQVWTSPGWNLQDQIAQPKDLAPAFPLELHGTCFAGGNKDSDSKVLLWEEM